MEYIWILCGIKKKWIHRIGEWKVVSRDWGGGVGEIGRDWLKGKKKLSVLIRPEDLILYFGEYSW